MDTRKGDNRSHREGGYLQAKEKPQNKPNA